MIQSLKDLLGPSSFLIEPMDLERDYREIDHLFEQEEWPFLRSDLEVSHAQPMAVALVARLGGSMAGFFATHAFGPIGYLDMMITVPEFRRRGVTRHLYVAAMHALRENGLRSFAVHTTNDSARLIQFLGFKSGQTFTLMRREPLGRTTSEEMRSACIPLGTEYEAKLIALDAEIFGLQRPSWIKALLAQRNVLFFGHLQDGQLKASLCLRPRKNNAFCLDGVHAKTFSQLRPLITAVLARYTDLRLECFVRTDSELHDTLTAEGFFVPEFFKAIGPLVEWRKGETTAVGLSPQIQCLDWF